MNSQQEMPLNDKQNHSDDKIEKLLKPKKTIRIAVSGDVLITELERKIIDTDEFQRLRRIRQLGTAYYVYPTAVHTRFDHSLGTLHMAKAMIDAIRNNVHVSDKESEILKEDEVLIRLYALIHDVPHVPYGHSFEDELGIFKRHDNNKDRINYFIGEDSTIGKLIIDALGKKFHNRLFNIYNHDPEDDDPNILKEDYYIYDIVSNTVCADLLDYLKRDDYFCNLSLHPEFRFLKFLFLKNDKKGRRRVLIRLSEKGKEPRPDTLSDIHRLLNARYYLAERVYFHHAKIITAAMLGRSMTEVVNSGDITEEDLYAQTDKSLHTDDILLDYLCNSNQDIAANLAKSLRRRELHKSFEVFDKRFFQKSQNRDHDTDVIGAVVEKVGNRETRTRIENSWADFINVEHGDILIYAPSTDMNSKEAKMRVMWRGEQTPVADITNEDVSRKLESIRQSHENLWKLHVFVKPSLDDEQKEIIRDAVAYEFTKLGNNHLFKDVINYWRTHSEDVQNISKEIDHEGMPEAVKELKNQYHKSPNLKKLITSVITDHFQKK